MASDGYGGHLEMRVSSIERDRVNVTRADDHIRVSSALLTSAYLHDDVAFVGDYMHVDALSGRIVYRMRTESLSDVMAGSRRADLVYADQLMAHQCVWCGHSTD